MFYGGAPEDEKEEETEVMHEDNEWGIEIVKQETQEETPEETDVTLPDGIEYSAPIVCILYSQATTVVLLYSVGPGNIDSRKRGKRNRCEREGA